MNTEEYWENRYSKLGNSGAGSYGRLAEFKADVINSFIADKKIKVIKEFGCGDGNQLALLKAPLYMGYDVSQTVIDKLKKIHESDKSKAFYHISDYDKTVIKADLTLSLDVLYHLLEDEVFNDYMEKLFDTSDRYVIIYSCHRNDISNSLHIKFRTFLTWVLKNRPEWRLIDVIENAYPYDRNDPNHTSWSDFYIFERTK